MGYIHITYVIARFSGLDIHTHVLKFKTNYVFRHRLNNSKIGEDWLRFVYIIYIISIIANVVKNSDDLLTKISVYIFVHFNF